MEKAKHEISCILKNSGVDFYFHARSVDSIDIVLKGMGRDEYTSFVRSRLNDRVSSVADKYNLAYSVSRKKSLIDKIMIRLRMMGVI